MRKYQDGPQLSSQEKVQDEEDLPSMPVLDLLKSHVGPRR